MKRVFIFLSLLICSIFTLFISRQEYQSLIFASFDAVDIVGISSDQKVANREELTRSLNELAVRENSIIARRIVEPNETGEKQFIYEIYGEGEIPSAINVASPQSAQTSDLINSYLILAGSLTSQQLSEELHQLGYLTIISPSNHVLLYISGFLSNEIVLLSFLLFLLTFLAITMIYRIKELRNAGIKRIAGQSYIMIMKSSIMSDLREISISFAIVTTLSIVVMCIVNLFHPTILVLYITIQTFYALTLVLISIILSFIYIIGMKATALVEILKGRLPLKQLITIMFVGQILAVLVTGWSLANVFKEYERYHEIARSEQQWQTIGDFFQFKYSYGSAFNNSNNHERQKRWYEFAKVALEQQDAMFVKHNLINFMMSDHSDSVSKVDYHPTGNTLMVSANYLELAQVEVSQSYLDQMKQLKEGEFGFILPRKLEPQQNQLEQVYSEMMTSFSSETLDSDSPKQYQAKAIVTYVPNGRDRFLLNTQKYVDDQYVTDPIIVVTSPTAMGNGAPSLLFWESETANSLFLKEYQKTIDLLKSQHVYQEVSYVLSSQRSYISNLAESRNRFFVFIIGTVLGLLTSILLFDTMNLLYFEQFRRDIFIKRLAGMNFVELHFDYLAVQLIVLFASTTLLLFLTKNIKLSLLVCMLFALNMLIILLKQSQTENKTAVTVLKGK